MFQGVYPLCFYNIRSSVGGRSGSLRFGRVKNVFENWFSLQVPDTEPTVVIMIIIEL